MVQTLTHFEGQGGKEGGMEGERGAEREREREIERAREKERGVGEIEYMEYYNKPNLYLPISFYFCKKIFLEKFHNFLRVKVH